MEDIQVTFGAGKRVSARVGNHTVHTDQPSADGGNDEAPGPFELFLASLATCAGYYVLAFCRTRDLSTDGIALRQHVDVDPTTHLPNRVSLTITLPASFPEKYRHGVIRAAESCKVKRTIAAVPTWEIAVTTAS